MSDDAPPTEQARERTASDAVENASEQPSTPALTTTVGTPRWWIPASVAGIVLVGLLIANQLYLVVNLNSTQQSLTATRQELSSLESHVGDVNTAVSQVSSDIESLAATEAQSSSSPAPVLPTGSLPRFVSGQPDSAIGMTLSKVSGPNAYSDGVISIDPGDGTKRIWMVWAHWCPYCQQELPSLTKVYEDVRDTYPDIDVATVTTSIDPARGNPLDAYLAEQQFPFTVIVDDNLSLASQIGVSAFPFWVITDGQGRVLYRTAGYLDETQFLNLVASLDAYELEA